MENHRNGVAARGGDPLMRLYLVQHGDALDKAADPERPLSPAGIADVQAVAAALSRLGLPSADIWHSGKTRARQTAELLAPAFGGLGRLCFHDGLAPNDNIAPFKKDLERREEDLVVAGHLPFLERVCGRLICGDENATPVTFQKGAALCLERRDGAFSVRWMITPELAGR